MRPVNLIPEDQRRGPSADRKGSPLAYVVVGALIVLLAGVTTLVLTNNQISSDKDEVVKLERENQTAEAKVSKLAAYTQLREVSNDRVSTVTDLAESRFDWERVMRELALIIPHDIWLLNLTGTVNPTVTVEGGATVASRISVPGPALQIIGCAKNQDAVAGFISSLKDIDGATRVGLQASKRGENSSEATTDAASGSSADCPPELNLPKFELVVAFDSAPIVATAATE
jgi:Tfp pilus assembly protein PilN